MSVAGRQFSMDRECTALARATATTLSALVLVSCGTEDTSARSSEDPTGQGQPTPVTSTGTVSPEPVPSASTSPPLTTPVVTEPGIEGRVTADGSPVPGAMIQPAPGPGNPAPEREVFALSAADGTFALGLTPGLWEITISADAYQPQVLEVTVPDGETVHADVALEPAG